ncbi:MAG: UDP-N-acetylmuramate--L-alanine ligase [Verrucomicrobiae bacterium]|nr:UDP-N-acetylmuramate--L-alanine ligase [Verrucomicrobiae bacterium]
MEPAQVDELLRCAPRETVYLVGAGGIGMSAIGHLLLDLGFLVAGSDLEVNDQVRLLQARGAVMHIGHSAEQMEWARPVLVAYSSAVLTSNSELESARRLEIPIVRRATLLAALMRRQHGVCVAGMHGKTTTAAMLAHALKELALQPSYAIGGGVPQLGGNAHFASDEWISLTDGEGSETGLTEDDTYFVAEADESDGTLLQFEPRDAIILNIDEEHLDYYETFDAISAEFQAFADQTTGRLFYCADDPNLVSMFANRANAISYGFNPTADYQIEADAGRTTGRAFVVRKRGGTLGSFSTRLLGEKNLSNAGAVVAFLSESHVSAKAIASAIGEFGGAQRRQQLLFDGEDVKIYEDYAHHPLEIKATIEAFRELRSSRLLVAFQPHRFSRTQQLLSEFATCFDGADLLWITEIYAASELPIPGVNGAVMATAVRSHGRAVEHVPELADLEGRIRKAVRPGDVVLFLGAGDISRTARRMADEFQFDMNATNNESRAARLRSRVGGETVVRLNEPLAQRTTMRVGGLADLFAEPASEEDLGELLNFCREESLPVLMLGRGSNLLIRDGGVRGMVVSLGAPVFRRVVVRGEELHCGAGARLKDVAQAARDAGLAGLEFLEGIPGSVGGGLRMNAGAMGSEMFDRVCSLRFMDGEGKVHEVRRDGIEVGYRNCAMLKDAFALGVVLRGDPSTREAVAARMKDLSGHRWSTQPKISSAGCMFKNPANIPAGRLVDELGLKGTRVGGAEISGVHGNFMVNNGQATARDVLELIEIVRRRAREERGIELQIEVKIVGEER